jgi:hypothetical protein
VNGTVVEDIARKVGIGETTRTYGSLVFDYDGDRWPDLLLGRHSTGAHLYRNDRGRLRWVQLDAFGRGDRHRCAAGDVNHDERLDIVCAVGGNDGTRPKSYPNELWIQQPDGGLVNDGGRPDLADPYGRGRQPALFDMDGDGDLDMFVGNVSPRPDRRSSANRAFLNDGSDGWRTAPELGLDLELSVGGAGGNNFPQGCVESLDADGDGFDDLLICAKGKDDKYQRLHLFHNDDGRRFVDVTQKAQIAGPGLDASVVDMNDDDRPDIVAVSERALTVRLQDAQGRFPVTYTRDIDHGLRVAAADADGDGDQDLYLQRGDKHPGRDVSDLLLLNRGSSEAYTSIDIPAATGNSRADDVIPFDHDRDGRWAFLVLDGLSTDRAPVRLLALR